MAEVLELGIFYIGISRDLAYGAVSVNRVSWLLCPFFLENTYYLKEEFEIWFAINANCILHVGSCFHSHDNCCFVLSGPAHSSYCRE